MKSHTGELVCSVCGRQFTSQDSLGRHQRLHEGSGKNSVLPTCHICNKKCATPSLLKRHVASHERHNFKCSICGQDFANHQQLTAHQNKHHQSAVPALHRCHLCNKSFVKEADLNRHITTHSSPAFHQQNTTQSLPTTQIKNCESEAANSRISQGMGTLRQSNTACFLAGKKSELFPQTQTPTQMNNSLPQAPCGNNSYLGGLSQTPQQQHSHHLQSAQLHPVTVNQTSQQQQLMANTSTNTQASSLQAPVFLASVSYDPEILGASLQETAYQDRKSVV